MGINLFEGFRRLNIIVIIGILIVGTIIAFNESSYINKTVYVEGAKRCDTYIEKTEITNFGRAHITYCFKQSDKDWMDFYVSEYKWSDKDLKKLNGDARSEWIHVVIRALGVTLLIALGYFVFCKIIKYIVTGFIKNENNT